MTGHPTYIYGKVVPLTKTFELEFSLIIYNKFNNEREISI